MEAKDFEAHVRQCASCSTELAAFSDVREAMGEWRQQALGFYGTDLGWTFAHGGEMWVMFGDTWGSWAADSIAPDADDALAKISLREFPDGDSVERWVTAHPGEPRKPGWHAEAPRMEVALDAAGKPVPVRPVRDGVSLTSGPGLTPMTGFSNARTGAEAGAFSLFLQNEPVQCKADKSCDNGFECDPGVGQCAPLTVLSAPCVIGTTSCECVKVGPGLCQDRKSSVYAADSERGRSHSVVMRQQVGNALRDDWTRFASRSWDTRRFYNATARTVNDFDPAQPARADVDYAPADGRRPEREGVFVWGRPNFGGVRAVGRDAQLYLAWVPMPTYDARGQFRWEPRFFAGLDPQGRPRFTPREIDAKPLDLDANAPGDQPEELKDLVGQMSISWVPSLRRWVMMYGGGIGAGLTRLIFGADANELDLDPLGSIHIRYADQPWGPWTPPEPLLVAGAPERGVLGQYGPGGILHHGQCLQEGCAPGELAFLLQPREWGRLYAPNIIDPWTETRADGAVDLYWHVSTWAPYQVVLMRTRLTQPAR